MKPTISIALALSVVLSASAVTAQHDHTPPVDAATEFGRVHFETSCRPEVQKDFDRAVALLHSFWFSHAIQAFEDVVEKDAGCAMAHWGMAMSWWGNPFGGFRSPQALEAGQAAVAKARAAGTPTERERDYIGAVATLYQDYATVEQRTRTVSYEKAMEQLAAKYTGDPEARIFYALALDQTQLPNDKSYKNLLQAAAILEKEFASQPDHPGIAHYIIHSYDVPALAPRGLDAARRYAKIAPAVPHALHMPSHTFTRVGSWDESIETNIASAAAARKDPGGATEELHALDYQVYAYLQTARDEAANKVTGQIGPVGERIKIDNPGAAAPAPAGFFALAAIPARYALERAAWADAAKLEPRETPFLWPEAVTYFARALGAARSGNTAAATKDVAKLAELRDKLEAAKNAYWTEQVEIQRRAASAWVAYAEGRKDEALTLMREAADLEDATEKSAVSPGPIKPARELLGEMLLESGRSAEALAEFRLTIAKEPNRFRGFYGAARAAQASGDAESARTYYAKLVEVCARGDEPGRSELAEARRSVQ